MDFGPIPLEPDATQDMRGGVGMKVGEQRPSIQYRMRTVRIGLQATTLVLICLIVFPLLPGHEPLDMGPYVGVVVAAALAALAVAFLPWRGLFEDGLGEWALYIW